MPPEKKKKKVSKSDSDSSGSEEVEDVSFVSIYEFEGCFDWYYYNSFSLTCFVVTDYLFLIKLVVTFSFFT